MACVVRCVRMAGVFVPQHSVAMSPSSVYFSLKVQELRATARQVYVNRSSSVHRRAVCQKLNAAQAEPKVCVCAHQTSEVMCCNLDVCLMNLSLLVKDRAFPYKFLKRN